MNTMTLLTPEEKQRAWDRLLRGTGGPIILGTCSGSYPETDGGMAIHMAKGLQGLRNGASCLLTDECAYVIDAAVRMVKRRILADHRELRIFLKRNMPKAFMKNPALEEGTP